MIYGQSRAVISLRLSNSRRSGIAVMINPFWVALLAAQAAAARQLRCA